MDIFGVILAAGTVVYTLGPMADNSKESMQACEAGAAMVHNQMLELADKGEFKLEIDGKNITVEQMDVFCDTFAERPMLDTKLERE